LLANLGLQSFTQRTHAKGTVLLASNLYFPRFAQASDGVENLGRPNPRKYTNVRHALTAFPPESKQNFAIDGG
jgi:hypothetical protein